MDVIVAARLSPDYSGQTGIESQDEDTVSWAPEQGTTSWRGHRHIRTNAFTNGKVTGGTGMFKGATGTIKAKAITSKKEAVTITYSD